MFSCSLLTALPVPTPVPASPPRIPPVAAVPNPSLKYRSWPTTYWIAKEIGKDLLSSRSIHRLLLLARGLWHQCIGGENARDFPSGPFHLLPRIPKLQGSKYCTVTPNAKLQEGWFPRGLNCRPCPFSRLVPGEPQTSVPKAFPAPPAASPPLERGEVGRAGKMFDVVRSFGSGSSSVLL